MKKLLRNGVYYNTDLNEIFVVEITYLDKQITNLRSDLWVVVIDRELQSFLAGIHSYRPSAMDCVVYLGEFENGKI
jgi:hypothetical protein